MISFRFHEGGFMSDRDSSGILWFLAGLGIGAAVGILYAPRAGEDTRQAILDAADDGREYVVNRGRQAREHVGQWTARGKEALAQQKEQFKAAYEAGREAYQKEAKS
jgi:gas vesicle protein